MSSYSSSALNGKKCVDLLRQGGFAWRDKEQQKYPALKSLLTSRTESTLRQDKGNEEDDEKSTEKRFKRLKKAFADPLTEVYTVCNF